MVINQKLKNSIPKMVFLFQMSQFIFYYVTAISDLKNAFNKLEVRVSVLEGKTSNVSLFYLIKVYIFSISLSKYKQN